MPAGSKKTARSEMRALLQHNCQSFAAMLMHDYVSEVERPAVLAVVPPSLTLCRFMFKRKLSLMKVQIIPVAVATPYNNLPMMYVAARHSNLHIQQRLSAIGRMQETLYVVAGMLLKVKVQRADCGPYA